MGAEGSKITHKDEDEYVDPAEKNRVIAKMDETVRNRLRAGVQYNMKVILCGSRGSGKTSLWSRFQGLSFNGEYTPTPEIQSATINWTFRNQEEKVKVEVWDVVDIAINKSKGVMKRTASMTDEGSGQHVLELLDSSVVDIYKGTQAVIFLINPFSLLSLVYVRDKYKEVPLDISILILLNFRDLKNDEVPAQYANSGHPRITMNEIQTLCGEINAYRHQARSPVSHLTVNTQLKNVKIETLNNENVPESVTPQSPPPVESTKVSHVVNGVDTKEKNVGSGDKDREGDDVMETVSLDDTPATVPSVTDSATEAIKKLSLSNVDSIANTHRITHPVKLSAAESRVLYTENALVDASNDSVHAFDVSLLNCYGLVNVHKFLDIPFLRLKRQTLEELLTKVTADMTESNLMLRHAVKESDYDAYEQGYLQRMKDRANAAVIHAAEAQQRLQEQQQQQSQQVQQQQQHVREVAQPQNVQHIQQVRAAVMDGTVNNVGSYVSTIGQNNTGSQQSQQQSVSTLNSNDLARLVNPSLKSSTVTADEDEQTNEMYESEDGDSYIPIKRSKLVKGRRSAKSPSTPSLSESVSQGQLTDGSVESPKSSGNGGGLKLSHDSTREAMSYHKKETLVDKKDKKSKKKKDDSETKEVTSTVPSKVLSQFEQEIESFKPSITNSDSNSRSQQQSRDVLEDFFQPSDDEERSKLEHKERVRAYLRPNTAADPSDTSSPITPNSQVKSGVNSQNNVDHDENEEATKKSSLKNHKKSTIRKVGTTKGMTSEISFDEPDLPTGSAIVKVAGSTGGLRKPVRKAKQQQEEE